MQPSHIARRPESEREYWATQIRTQASGLRGYRRTLLYLQSSLEQLHSDGSLQKQLLDRIAMRQWRAPSAAMTHTSGTFSDPPAAANRHTVTSGT